MTTQYITPAQLDVYLGDEKARLLTAGLTPERYAQAIADISDEIAGYVGARVLAAVPAAFVHHGCAIARYRLNRDKASERQQKDLDLANKYFSDVQKGNVYLVLADDPSTPENESLTAGVWFSAQPSRFTGRAY
jgi:phage gp36-like protein